MRPKRRPSRAGLVLVAFACAAAMGAYLFLRMRDRDERAETRRRGQAIVTAIMKFQADRGQFPTRLDDLLGPYLSTIPEPAKGSAWSLNVRNGAFTLCTSTTTEGLGLVTMLFCYDSATGQWTARAIES